MLPNYDKVRKRRTKTARVNRDGSGAPVKWGEVLV